MLCASAKSNSAGSNHHKKPPAAERPSDIFKPAKLQLGGLFVGATCYTNSVPQLGKKQPLNQAGQAFALLGGVLLSSRGNVGIKARFEVGRVARHHAALALVSRFRLLFEGAWEIGAQGCWGGDRPSWNRSNRPKRSPLGSGLSETGLNFARRANLTTCSNQCVCNH
jgi:hypothetical protein